MRLTRYFCWKVWHALIYRHQPSQCVWVVGFPRSGTTWLGELVNQKGNYLELFEPFHPEHVSCVGSLPMHYYIPVNQQNSPQLDIQLVRFYEQIFNNKFVHEKVNLDIDFKTRKSLLVKDVFTLLFSAYLKRRFDHLRVVFIIRNPFEVIRSVYHSRHYTWVVDPLVLMNDPRLKRDFLVTHETFIRSIARKQSFLLNQLTIWCIVNGVALETFKDQSICKVVYGDIIDRPQATLFEVFEFLEIDAAVVSDIVSTALSRPSKTSKLSKEFHKLPKGPNEKKSILADDDLLLAQEIVKHFGFGGIVDENGVIDSEQLTNYSFPKATT